MSSGLMYTTVPFAQISQALSALFETGSDASIITRASGANVIVSGVGCVDANRATEMVEVLAPVHPARFFIPVVDESVTEPKAEVAAACVRVSSGSKVCSEVVRLHVPLSMQPAVPSIIRAHMLPGLASEVFVLRWDESAQLLISQSDQLFFDAAALPSNDLLLLVDLVLKSKANAVDFNWVRMGMWREAVKRLFDVHQCADWIPRIRSIRIHCACASEDGYDVSSYTLAGWLANRLGVEPVAYGTLGWECTRRAEGPLSLQILAQTAGSFKGVKKVEMFVDGGEDNPQVLLATIERGEMLEARLELGERLSRKRGIEDDSFDAIIERFFLVGDSTTNYESALRAGLEMFKLTRGFSG